MRILWLCNMAPGAVNAAQGSHRKSGMWLDQVLAGLREEPGVTLRVLCRYPSEVHGEMGECFSYRSFLEPLPQSYYPQLETMFFQELQRFSPDVIHIWGTEYGHSLAMMRAAEKLGLDAKAVVSIQGLCSVLAKHYCDGVPALVKYGFSLRDLLRLDNLYFQQKKFYMRGKMEIQTLQKAGHVIGRTHWDEYWTAVYQPRRQYHFCNETLREAFFTDSWSYDGCTPCRIFASSCSYPIKGFHILLRAVGLILQQYPQTTVTVTGSSFLPKGKGWLYTQGYQLYLSFLVKKYKLQGKISFLGSLTEQEMKAAMLDANVFVLPSVMENSPNSLGEAMLLGTPCVASEVGGVPSMLQAPREGLTFPAGDVQSLADRIKTIFAMEADAAAMGHRASSHARITHDPASNLQALVGIYRSIANCEE